MNYSPLEGRYLVGLSDIKPQILIWFYTAVPVLLDSNTSLKGNPQITSTQMGRTKWVFVILTCSSLHLNGLILIVSITSFYFLSSEDADKSSFVEIPS